MEAFFLLFAGYIAMSFLTCPINAIGHARSFTIIQHTFRALQIMALGSLFLCRLLILSSDVASKARSHAKEVTFRDIQAALRPLIQLCLPTCLGAFDEQKYEHAQNR